MNSTSQPEQFTFQAEIKQLLHLLSHSLYQNKEIAIRELVSNASDALDKMRHISLTDETYRDDRQLQIEIVPDKDAGTLDICDNGVGMSHDDLIRNLGTIAHSGSREFLSQLADQQEKGKDVSLIGQFGVGFYSAFMLADKVEVVSRSHASEEVLQWTSDGSGSFTIEAGERDGRGTTIRLQLKEGLEDFTDKERLQYILKKYSTFVPHPIILDGEQINEQQPIWVEPKSSLKEEQYNSFYQYISHRSEESPLWHLHLAADSPFQFHSILYCPPSNFELLGFGKNEHGLHLCAKRVLVQNDCRELLPEYLRFLHGLVDSADLPLNVSREALQDNTVFRKMKKVLVKRVLDHLGKIAKSDPAKFLDFHKQFGMVLREGIATDFENRERIAGLLRFQSSREADAWTSLDDYVERAAEDQKQIYFTTGPDVSVIERQPGLEIFRKRGLEVLYLMDAVDEIVLSTLGKYKDQDLVSIDAAEVDLPESSDAETEEEQSEETPVSGFEALLTLFREALGDRVEEVRKSERLIDSPCCLINPKGAMSTHLQKVLQLSDKDFEMTKRIFEVNAKSALIQRLAQLTANSSHVGFIKECGHQLFANAEMQAGLVPDLEGTVNRTHDFMRELAEGRSPIVT